MEIGWSSKYLVTSKWHVLRTNPQSDLRNCISSPTSGQLFFSLSWFSGLFGGIPLLNWIFLGWSRRFGRYSIICPATQKCMAIYIYIPGTQLTRLFWLEIRTCFWGIDLEKSRSFGFQVNYISSFTACHRSGVSSYFTPMIHIFIAWSAPPSFFTVATSRPMLAFLAPGIPINDVKMPLLGVENIPNYTAPKSFYIPWGPKTMKMKGFGQLKTMLFTVS